MREKTSQTSSKGKVFVHTGTGLPTEDLEHELEITRSIEPGTAHVFAYTWSSPVLVLGRSQTPEDVNAGFCESRSIPILKRKTGGTGVLHEETLNISLTLPKEHPSARAVQPLYDIFTDAVEGALGELGVPTTRPAPEQLAPRETSPMCFADFRSETLLHRGKKILGCAQWRTNRSVTVHGTIMLRVDPELQGRVFRMSVADVSEILGSLPKDRPPTPKIAQEIVERLIRAVERKAPNQTTPVTIDVHADSTSPMWGGPADFEPLSDPSRIAETGDNHVRT